MKKKTILKMASPALSLAILFLALSLLFGRISSALSQKFFPLFSQFDITAKSGLSIHVRSSVSQKMP